MAKNNFFRRLSAVLISSSIPSAAFAAPFSVLGPRAMGMGGAFVAVAEGPITQYWNPAGLAESEGKYGLQLPVGARAEFTGGVLQNANALGDLASKYSDIKSAQQTGAAGAVDADKVAAFYKAVANISELNQPGKGVLADVSGGGSFRVGQFALSVLNFTDVGGSPSIDTVNIGLTGLTYTNAGTTLCGGASCTGAPSAANQQAATDITNALGASGYASLNSITGGALAAGGIANATQLGNALVNMGATNGLSSAQISEAAAAIVQNSAAVGPILQSAASGNSFQNNQTNLTLRGASLTEIMLGHGRELLLPGLKVGGNFKLIMGKVGYKKFEVLNKDSGSTNSLSDFKDNSASSVQPAIDLGALWHLDRMLPFLPFNPRVGLVARDINNPKFSQPDAAKADGEGKYAANAQFRSGVAISPLKFWHVSMDLDLTRNNTPVPGYHSRMWGLGTEVNVFNRSWINIPLRLGLAKNIAETSSKMSYTGGFGLNFLHFMLDVGGQVSADRTTIDAGSSSNKVPSNASVAVQLGFVF